MITITYQLNDQPTVEDVLANSASGYWLKATLAAALEKDPLKVTKDVEIILAILRARLVKLGIK